MSDDFATKADLKEAITASETRLLERMDALAERVETRLLTEFHKYALASERRITVTEVATHTLSDRMAAIETRVRELERKSQRDNIM